MLVFYLKMLQLRNKEQWYNIGMKEARQDQEYIEAGNNYSEAIQKQDWSAAYHYGRQLHLLDHPWEQ